MFNTSKSKKQLDWEGFQKIQQPTTQIISIVKIEDLKTQAYQKREHQMPNSQFYNKKNKNCLLKDKKNSKKVNLQKKISFDIVNDVTSDQFTLKLKDDNLPQINVSPSKQIDKLEKRYQRIPIIRHDDDCRYMGGIVYRGFAPKSSDNYFRMLKQVNFQQILNQKSKKKKQWKNNLLFEFNSKFQSGNLNIACQVTIKQIRINEREFDLYMKVDTNTNGHRQWFFFSIKNKQKGKIKLKIFKFRKFYSLYQRGMRPYTLSIKNGGQWKPSGQNVCYKKQRLPNQYGILKSTGCYYLSFDYQFQNEDDQVYFAAGIPYTYSFLQQRLQQLRLLPKSKITFTTQKLSKSMCGLQITLITIQPLEKKSTKPKIIIVNARTHSGQTSSSWVMDGLLDQICHSYEIQQWINRQNICFKIIPMLNPDGVFVGNYRTGIIGDDFNRRFFSGKKQFFPQINALKKLVIECKKQGDVQLFLDLHGHSILKNSFIYGPSQNQFSNVKLKKLPFYLWHSSKYFRMASCKFKSQKDKIQTARIYFQIKQSILSFTCENSLGLYHNQNKTIQMKKQDWINFGQSIAKSMSVVFDEKQSIQTKPLQFNQQKNQIINPNSQKQSLKINKKIQTDLVYNKQKIRKEIMSDFKGTLTKQKRSKQESTIRKFSNKQKDSTAALVNQARKRLPSLNSKQSFNFSHKQIQSDSRKIRQSLKLSSTNVQENQGKIIQQSKQKLQTLSKFKIRRRSEMIKYLPQNLKNKISLNKIQFSPNKKYPLDDKKMQRSMTFDQSYLANQISNLTQLQQNQIQKFDNNDQKMSTIFEDDFSDKYNDSINDSDCSSQDLCQQQKNYIMDYIRANQIRKRERFQSLESLKSDQQLLQHEETSPQKNKINAFKQIVFQPQTMEKQISESKNKTIMQFNNKITTSKQIYRNPHKFKQVSSSNHSNGNKSFGGMKLSLGQEYQDEEITIIQRKKLNERLGRHKNSQRDPFVLMYIKQKNEERKRK